MRSRQYYNGQTLQRFIGAIAALLIVLFVCFLAITRHPPTDNGFVDDDGVEIAAPTTGGNRIPTRARRRRVPQTGTLAAARAAIEGSEFGKGNMRVDWDKEMLQRTEHSVAVFVSKTSIEELQENVRASTHLEAGIDVSTSMQMKLDSDGTFDKSGEDYTEVIGDDGKIYGKWFWRVTPKEVGSHPLTITPVSLIEGAGKTDRFLPGEPKSIPVTVLFNWSYWWYGVFLEGAKNWFISLVAVLASLLGPWVWKKFRRLPTKPDGSSQTE